MKNQFALILVVLCACSGKTDGTVSGPGATIPPGGVPPGVIVGFDDSVPSLGTVQASANLDSVIITVPAVAGAKDYRAFALPQGATVSHTTDHREHVDGTVIYCGGVEQHNAPLAAEVPVRQLEITNVTGPVHIVVEALDRLCPFPGLMGKTHADVQYVNPIGPDQGFDPAWRQNFAFFTEAEIRARYGSLIVNGQGASGTVGQPAPANDPVVLGRSQLDVAPLPASAKPSMTFFDDFAAGDQPVPVTTPPNADAGRSSAAQLYQNGKWGFYAFGFAAVQPYVDRGQLQIALADNGQDVFASVQAIPKKPVALPADSSHYLHVTWEVETNATSRRYWQVQLCGAATLGQTIDSNGFLKQPIVPTSGFMEADGLDPSVPGWNCLQVFPRDGWPATLAGAPGAPETDLRVMVNTANSGGNNRTNVVNVSPNLYSGRGDGAAPGWFRQLGANHLPSAPMLDDLQRIAPRVHWDLYVKRNRVILYANGAQRLCNDFPGHALTMAEAALSFEQVLYHSAAERLEFMVNYWDKRGQRFYINNAAYADLRGWDNMGYDENTAAPAGFDSTLCYNNG